MLGENNANYAGHKPSWPEPKQFTWFRFQFPTKANQKLIGSLQARHENNGPSLPLLLIKQWVFSAIVS